MPMLFIDAQPLTSWLGALGRCFTAIDLPNASESHLGRLGDDTRLDVMAIKGLPPNTSIHQNQTRRRDLANL